MNDSPRSSAASIFEAALDLDPADREAYVREVCGESSQLRDEVLALLTADASADGFLGAPPAVERLLEAVTDDEAGVDGEEGHPDLGTDAGPYRLRELIGRGGMGAVFLAERVTGDFQQRVAVKILRRGMDTEDLLQRFFHERRLLARLEHPNIARLLDGGVTGDGRPFLAMEYVDGERLDVYCDEAALGVRGRLQLFLEVCAAVQHAHRNLIVHRDLKPSNILVTREGRVKLLDFGIAKVVDPDDRDVALTATHARLLSPRYCSPEQMRAEPVTTASDVYSLGVVLYELLTGRSPYAAATGELRNIERRVLTVDPQPPSTVVTTTTQEAVAREVDVTALRRRLRGDLDTIVLKALRKEAQRRYSSVDELAADIRRHLQGQPVLARPDSFGYRAGKFLRRNFLAVAASAVVALALVVATGVSTVLYVRADRAQREAEAERRTAEQVGAFLQEMLGSINPFVARGEDTALLERLLVDAGRRIDEELADQPEVAASLHHTLGRAYLDLGSLESAEHHLVRAASLWSDEPAQRGVDRGFFYFEAGRYGEATEELERCVDRALTAGDSVSAARARYWWGKSLEATGGSDSALVHLRAADSILRQVGAGRERLAVLGGTAAFLVNNRQQYDEADSLYQVALGIADRVDPGPLEVGNLIQGYATAKRRRGDLAAADSLYAVAMLNYSEGLKEDHPTIASLQDEWAGCLEELERTDEAEALYRVSLRKMRRVYGSEHRQVGTVANNLANLLRKTGRHEEAMPLFEEALSVYRSALGEEHAWVGIILGNVSANLLAKGDARAALTSADECRRIRMLYWPEDHWRVAAAVMIRGAARSQLGDYDAAEVDLLESLRVFDATFGKDATASVTTIRHLRELYDQSGRAAPDSIVARW